MTITQEDNLLIQSYITVSFLLELKNLDFLNSDYYKNAEFQDKYVQESITTIGIDNQGSMLMALYAMLVIPKEKIKSRFESEFDKLNEVVNTIKNDAKTESDYTTDSEGIDYVSHIRNAVAHAKVSFIFNTEVAFSDTRHNNKTKKDENCTITIPLADFGMFMNALQKLFFKYVEDYWLNRNQ
ncbi:HEPN family nuclease [Psychrobacter sp. LV10R520-6]|uniref:HEPN family nuclease n=1 Tax=Psychrobacter sp. LV10R520-6 TaxID=1415574 RepID=UPI0024C9EA4E|nr:HEPN family nuclease [Psychrobacter sp. LV10R520-6]SNT69542.1 hypothetical protein SAMN04488491_0635 [Psychrobacter sp. LV10R520-6]